MRKQTGDVMTILSKIAGLKAMMAFTNRWQLIFNRLLFSRSLDMYVLDDTIFLIDYEGGDASGTRECIVSDMYKQYLPYMALKGNITLLDIGANGGGFPLLLRVEGVTLSKVVCVEMNPNTFNRLRYNIHANIGYECTCINGALSNSSGSIDLILGPGSTSDSIYQKGKTAANNERMYKISTMTLDYLINNQFDSVVDIVKMDIEGAEYDVLLGDGCSTLTRIRYLLIEIHNNLKIPKEVLIEKIKWFDFTELPSSSRLSPDVYCFASRKHTIV
jgi:FkbM family methyltransferase